MYDLHITQKYGKNYGEYNFTEDHKIRTLYAEMLHIAVHSKESIHACEAL